MEDQIAYVWGDPNKATVKKIVGDTVYIIPFDESNLDYQDFLKWQDEGNAPGPYPVSTPADGVEDLGSAKAVSSTYTRQIAYSLLLPTDWVTSRKVDTGEDIPADIDAFRSAVRSAAAEKIATVSSKSSLEDLVDYLRSDAFTEWPEPPTV